MAILDKIEWRHLVKYRRVNKAWQALIDAKLFDDALLNDKNHKVSFYVPVYENLLRIQGPSHNNALEWNFINSQTMPRYFYRSMEALFHQTKALGCYKVRLSYTDITEKNKIVAIECHPRRYYMYHAAHPHDIVSYISRNCDETLNPLYLPEKNGLTKSPNPM